MSRLDSNTELMRQLLQKANSLPEATEVELQDKTVTENGAYTADEGYTGLGTVTVAVPENEPSLQDKAVTPTKSTQEVTADEGFDGIGKVTVGAIPAEYIVPNGTKNITENGTHDVTANASVAVNVPIPDGYIVPSGTKNITENGTHNVNAFDSVAVNVPVPDGYIVPSGALEITENGEYDVTDKARVTVAVEGSGTNTVSVTIKCGGCYGFDANRNQIYTPNSSPGTYQFLYGMVFIDTMLCKVSGNYEYVTAGRGYLVHFLEDGGEVSYDIGTGGGSA